MGYKTRHLCAQKLPLYLNPATIHEISNYKRYSVHSRLSYFKHAQKAERAFAYEIAKSLGSTPKSISPKFFYDEQGSILFEQICNIPEYYLTRTEAEILERISNELAPLLVKGMRLVELGSGSSYKTRLILDILDNIQDRIEYCPIDISDILRDSCIELLDDYSSLHVTGVIDTYHDGLEFVKNMDETPSLIAFLGSSFGNFDPKEGRHFLDQIRASMKNSDMFMIGLDLVKDKSILECAYDDPSGVTARFNMNVLARINCELNGDFDLEKFSHIAKYNKIMQRIEMYLRSDTDQTVHIPKSGIKIHLQKNELVHTENSYKFTISQIREMMSNSGFEIDRIWQDDNKQYALVLCSTARR